jgi:hypothetical protein
MDAAGAKELRKRLEGQAHWTQAEAVQDGRQPPTDPDAPHLEEIGDGVRYYEREQHSTTVDGRDAVVTFRIVKQLVDGEWRGTVIQEDVEFAS